MIDALGIVSAAMAGDVARLDVIGHNLANANTAGYKRAVPIASAFGTLLDASPAMPAGGPMTDLRGGAIRYSGNPLDIAIEGDAWFEVMRPQGPAYTRQGQFHLDGRGRLLTAGDLPVMGSQGEIVLSSSHPRIDGHGRIFDGDREIGSLKLVHFDKAMSLRPLGDGLYLPDGGLGTPVDLARGVRQGYVEASNVNGMTEMVKLMETMRHFESGQKIVQAYDDMLGKTLQQLGQF